MAGRGARAGLTAWLQPHPVGHATRGRSLVFGRNHLAKRSENLRCDGGQDGAIMHTREAAQLHPGRRRRRITAKRRAAWRLYASQEKNQQSQL